MNIFLMDFAQKQTEIRLKNYDLIHSTAAMQLELLEQKELEEVKLSSSNTVARSRFGPMLQSMRKD